MFYICSCTSNLGFEYAHALDLHHCDFSVQIQADSLNEVIGIFIRDYGAQIDLCGANATVTFRPMNE